MNTVHSLLLPSVWNNQVKDSTQSAAVECMEQPGEYSTQSTAVGEDSPQSTADKHMEETAEYSPQSTACPMR